MNSSRYHESAVGHVSGTAEYIDDRPTLRGEVHVEVFYSSQANARIRRLNIEKCLKCPGVVQVFTYKDLQHNSWGSIFKDQVFLASDEVQFVGEAIAIIAAETKQQAIEAKKTIEVQYSEQPAILTLDEAIEKKSFIAEARSIQRGNVEIVIAQSDHQLSGCIEMAGQDHFYLESQACIAYPKEDGQIELHSSSQHPSEVQHLVAEALGLKFNQVVCIVKRMGGAFGGKESQAGLFAVFAALVAQKLNRPARLVLGKDDDMIMTGKRNPFKNYYKVGFSNQGKIQALSVEFYSDGGAYADLSTAIMERAMLHIDNAYHIPNVSVTGQVCKTNTPPNTAFRGFGGPKGVSTIESIIEDIAHLLKKDALEIRKANVYQPGQKTHYGQEIKDETLPLLFSKLEEKCDYANWRSEIDKHNADDKASTLRGLSATAVKFGISFTTRFLNQGNALVNIQLDGSIQVSTGATEMGQGVNTKIGQIVSDFFSIPFEDVRVMPTSTEKNPNTSATAASSGSDINGQATLNACIQLKETLSKVAVAALQRPKDLRGRAVAGAGTAEEIDFQSVTDFASICFSKGEIFHKDNPTEKISFADLVEEAYLNRASLTAQGFFRYPGIHFNKLSGQGKPFHYYTNGVAASEVSIDKYTGELKVLKTELLMDLGRPINHGIDIGQVTGAFVQGMGWVTTENLYYEKGKLLSCSPSTYKIPSIHDIPREFNCDLLESSNNPNNVRGSKAVGEPPLLLAISVWTSIKNALSYKSEKIIDLKIPATQEQIYQRLREY